MGLVAVQCHLRGFGLCQPQPGAVIDRREPACELALALAVEIVSGLIAGVKAAGGLELARSLSVAGRPVRLAGKAVPMKAEPGEIGFDAVGKRLRRTLTVSVVHAK